MCPTFLAAAILCPAAIVLHEHGHATAATLAGVPVRVHYAMASYEGVLSPRQRLVFGAAGPAVEVLLGALGMALLARRARKTEPEAPFGLDGACGLGLALAWLRGIKALVSGLGLLPGLPGLAAAGLDDEGKLSVGLGLPPWGIALAWLATLGVAFAIGCARWLPAGKRLALVGVACVGGALGGSAWILVLGPRMLP